MKLYHGSNVIIDKIDLSLCNPDKDFGKGFYLSDVKRQAEDMAQRRCRFTGKGEPCVTTFDFDESCLTSGALRVLQFKEPDEEWAKFILENRKASKTGYSHHFDIIIGPIADDGVALQLNRYLRGLIDMKTLVKELTYRELSRQYYFGTELSITKLSRIWN